MMKFLNLSLLITISAASYVVGQTNSLTLVNKILIHDGKEIQADYGILEVPENRLASHDSKIQLAFVRLRSLSKTPRTPLLYLAGGPGGSSMWMAENQLGHWKQVLEVCDLIFLDQRATGQSTPNLLYRYQGLPPLDFFTSEEAALRQFQKLSDQALEYFSQQGIDLKGYTSVQSSDDINELRIALGLDKISLFGFSYGSHLALATIRKYEPYIDQAVLMGIEGPNHTFKLPLNMDFQFERIAHMAAKDPLVNEQIPNLIQLYDEVIEKLVKEPIVVQLNGPSGEKLQVPIGPFGLNAILRFDIGDASDIPVFPKLLHSISQGDPSILAWFIQKRAGMAMGTNGMAFMMDSSSGATSDRHLQIREQAKKSRFGNIMNMPFMIDHDWPKMDLGDAYRSPVISDVKTLFLSGSLDWNAPPFQAEEVRLGFNNSNYIQVKNAGHEQIIYHPNIQQAIIDFLRGEDVSHVTAEGPDIKFVPIDHFDPEITHPSVSESNYD